MTTPLVTICMPAYKAARYLAATLESVRAQSFTQWELVVVEDGSRDDTEKIVREFAAGGPQPVRYLRHEHNQGLSATRNTGFKQAQTELLAILDADDLWRPDHLQRSLATLDSSGAGLVFSGCQLFDSDSGAELETRVPPQGSMEEFPLSLHDGRVTIQPSTVLLRRELVERSGFDSTFPICNDLEFWFRMAKSGVRFAYTGAITCDYRKHATALSQRSTELVTERAQIYALHRDWEAIPAHRRRLEVWRHHRDAARMSFRANPLRALKQILRGLSAAIWL